MSDMGALDEIQAIFFEECSEGLSVAEEGLSAMAGGNASSEVIGGVFRAVHSIKGGAGAFGHAPLTAFAHRFENVLDEIRAGRIAPDAPVTKVLLQAFDILSDHVAAARGQADAPADAAVLAALDGVLGVKAAAPAAPTAPAPAEEADEFGFVPVAVPVDLDLDLAPAADGEGDWQVVFGPSRAALANGGEPLLVIRELEDMGGRVVAADVAALPGLRDLDPEDGYCVWTIELPAATDEAAIRDCFDFVAPDSRIEIGRVAAPVPQAVAAAVAAPARVAPAAAPPVPALSVNEPVDGMIVRLGGQRYVLPLASVVETVRPERGQIRPLSDAAGMIELRGRYLPVCRIADLLGIDTGAARAAEDSVIIIVETMRGGPFGLMADAIENRCDVMLRPLEENLHPVRGLAGVTVLDDDAIALILDIETMVADAGVRHPGQGMAA